MMNSYPEILHYIGRYHVLLLHMPIGFIAIAFLMEITARLKKTAAYDAAIVFILFWSAILSVLTSVSGYFLSFEGGYETTMLDQHFWLGIGTTVLTFVIYRLKKSGAFAKFAFPGFAVLVGLLLFTGHVGGGLTHGVDHLTTYRPVFKKYNRSKKDTPLITGSTEVYMGIIQPIFADKCVQCHNAQKLKGGLLMTSADALKKGGDNGSFLKAGDLDQSLFLNRVHLPLDEKEHMPPRGKNQLTEDEVSLLEWWVEEGATFTEPLDSLKKSGLIESIIDKKNLRPKGVFALDIPQPNASKLKALNDEGIRIWRLAQGSPLLQVDLSNNKELTNKAISKLSTFSEQIFDLNLGNSKVDDRSLKAVAKLPHLSRLYLEGTNITDAGLKQLKNLEYLEYLNLYQTEITDAGLTHLEKLKSLESLYLWQTKTTEKGIQKLKATLPKLDVTAQSGDDVFAEVKLNAPTIVVHSRQSLFSDTLSFKLRSTFKGAAIYYTLDGSAPTEKSNLFTDSVLIEASVNLQAIALREGWTASDVVQKHFVKVGRIAKKVTWNKEPSPDYPGKGPQALSDLIRAGAYTKSPAWMGWQGSNVTAIFDYGEAQQMQNIKIGFFENTNAWIFAPKGLKVWTSNDGKNYKKVLTKKYTPREEPSGVEPRLLSHDFDPVTARYVKIELENNKKNPSWHLAPGEPSWLFLDEIILQ